MAPAITQPLLSQIADAQVRAASVAPPFADLQEGNRALQELFFGPGAAQAPRMSHLPVETASVPETSSEKAELSRIDELLQLLAVDHRIEQGAEASTARPLAPSKAVLEDAIAENTIEQQRVLKRLALLRNLDIAVNQGRSTASTSSSPSSRQFVDEASPGPESSGAFHPSLSARTQCICRRSS